MERTRMILITLLFAVAANALVAGYLFMSDPEGDALKASVGMLRFSPFKNFFVPGLILFVVNGVFNLLAGLALIRRWKHASLLLFFQGALLTGWIVVQVLMLHEFNILHAVFGSIGVLFCAGSVFLMLMDNQQGDLDVKR